MAQNITLLGASYSSVPAVELPKTGGGTASFTDVSDTTATASDVLSGKYFYTNAGVKTLGTGSGGSVTQDQDGFIVLPPTGGGSSGNWSWMGENPTKVETAVNVKEYLKDTAYATWTPTTTATALVNATTLESKSYNKDYDYIITLKYHSHFEYTASATGSLQAEDWYYSGNTCLYGYYGGLESITTNTPTIFTKATNQSYGLFYKGSSGYDSYGNVNYGVYVSSWGGASNYTITNGTLNFQIGVPSIYARCSNSYFSTTNAEAVDQTTSYYEYKIEVWRVDKGTSFNGALVENVRDMWLNGF